MQKDFRREVFSLCNKLQSNEIAVEIGSLIHALSISKESEETGAIIKNAHGDFSYLAKNSNSEFHGFLFVDDYLETLEMPSFIDAKHLSTDERLLIERGHITLLRFVELCLAGVASASSKIADVMNPYYLYKEVKVSPGLSPILPDEDLINAAEAFQSGPIYKELLSSNCAQLFSRIKVEQMHTLFGILEREVKQSLGEDIVKDLRDFSFRIASKVNNANDAFFAYSILIYALKESLRIACRTLYRSICGIELFVLNNNDIINLEKRTSNTVCEFYKVLSQKLPLDFSGSEMGSVLLIDCDLPHETHIHEFGMITAETISFASEYGDTAKFSFVTVNKELVPIHRLTDTLLKVGLPPVQVVTK